MATREPAYVGLMSGTSTDGITAVVVRFHPRGARLSAELLAHVQRPYAPAERERLQQAMVGGTAREYCRLGFDVGRWLGETALQAIAEAGVARADLRAVGSHGHTIWHEAPHSTWQLGESAVIAERTGLDVVADFRVADLAAGGQGAPLVPLADAILFSADDEWRALQNIGGIGNVTVVPPAGNLDGVRAFDTGPGVAVTDGVVARLFPGMTFDRDGGLAAKGRPVTAVVEALLAHPYFAAEPPKSTGREMFDARYIDDVVRRCRETGASNEDIVATAVELTARSIADAYQRFLPEPVADVLLSGGGARHPVLVDRLRALLKGKTVRRFEDEFWDGEAKEAVAFALLARRCLDGEAGNVPRATGAAGPRIIGKVQRASDTRRPK